MQRKVSRRSCKTVFQIKDYQEEQAELALSLDVIYHLNEDEIYEEYMQQLFKAGIRYISFIPPMTKLSDVLLNIYDTGNLQIGLPLMQRNGHRKNV